MPTTPVQIRLTDDDKKILESVKHRNNLATLAAAIRFCASFTDRHQLAIESESVRRVNRKKIPG